MVRRNYSAALSILQGHKIITVQKKGFLPHDYSIGAFDAEHARLYTEHVVWHHSGTAFLCGLVTAKMGFSPT